MLSQKRLEPKPKDDYPKLPVCENDLKKLDWILKTEQKRDDCVS